MEITGKLIQINDPVTGESARGPWKKQELIIETQEQFPKKVCLLNWNDKVDISGLNTGDNIKASVNIESREFKGRWFTDVKVWKINTVDKTDAGSTPPENEAPPPGKDEIQDDPFAEDAGSDDDLPF